MNKVISLILSVIMLTTSFVFVVSPVNAETSTSDSQLEYNFAKALQMSLYFYDAEKCGPGVAGGRLAWRGACHVKDQNVPLIPKDENKNGTNMSQAFIDANRKILDPDGKGTLDLSGGMHDAGDHVKFGLPQAYAASTLGWGFYEFRDAYKKVGEEQHAIEILRWFTDYFLKCTYRDSNGDIVAFCYQVGDGDIDHCYWGSPEMQDDPRPAYFATVETPASDICGDTSAALAISYLNFKDTDPQYAKQCLDVSKALYRFAVKNRGIGYSGGFYGSAYDEDELSWAAVWLNIATGEKSYINDIVSEENGEYTGYIKKILPTTKDNWNNIWVHCWDAVWGGVFAKLAPVTNTERDWYFYRWNVEYWSGVPRDDPNDKTYMKPTPAGFRVICGWGSARYNTAAQLCALVYTKYKGKMAFAEWAKGQMEYIMGNNPKNTCYIVGYSDISSKHPHHRAAHGSTTNNMNDPPNHKHTLYGALVGGPGGSDDYNDVTTDYVYNEVSIDYNAGFVGALAGLYTYYGEGQEPLKNFPPPEPKAMEYYTEAKVTRENSESTQVTVNVSSKTVQPPRAVDKIKFRYYFNINELKDYNQNINDISVAIMYDEHKTYDGKGAIITGPVKWDEAGDYYYEFSYQSGIFGDRELQFAITSALDSSYKSNWNPSNDYSRQGLSTDYILSKNIPMYIGDTLVYGEEPPKSDHLETPTATPNPGLMVLNQCGNTKPEDYTICQLFQLVNTGNVPLNYKDIKIRYWYTSDSSTEQSALCDYAHIGQDNINLSCSSPNSSTKDAYLEIGFKDTAGMLGPGSNSGDIVARISNNDYSSFTQSNDYSFNSALSTFKENPHITAYIDGKLFYGKEPEGATTYGDVNMDGKIDSKDLVVIKRYTLGIPVTIDTNSADLNQDTKINSTDYSILKRYILGIITSLPH